MASIRGADTRPERQLRAALWASGVRGWRCNYPGPGGRIDIAFTRWRVAVFVDGSFWHGHPSKWQPNRWTGYWDEKIKRNIARDERHNAALETAGWRVLRFWDFDVEQDAAVLASEIVSELARAGRPRPPAIVQTPPDAAITPLSAREPLRADADDDSCRDSELAADHDLLPRARLQDWLRAYAREDGVGPARKP